jgi:hypothetical protein
MEKPIRVEGIDVEIQIVFRAHHLEQVLPHYHKVGLPAHVLNDMIDAYIASGEQVPYERWILEYGQKVINPLMNKKLGRPVDHPTFNNLLKFALKEVIENDSILKQFKKL